MMSSLSHLLLKNMESRLQQLKTGMQSYSLIFDLTVQFNCHVHLQMHTFDEFETKEKRLTNLKFVTFTHYSDEVLRMSYSKLKILEEH